MRPSEKLSGKHMHLGNYLLSRPVSGGLPSVHETKDRLIFTLQRGRAWPLDQVGARVPCSLELQLNIV